MKYNLYEQFSPENRAILLLNKYPLDYIKDLVNGIILQTRKKNETEMCNYWNEVSIEIKKRIARNI
jgi:hypothetical protein